MTQIILGGTHSIKERDRIKIVIAFEIWLGKRRSKISDRNWRTQIEAFTGKKWQRKRDIVEGDLERYYLQR